ncbi:MAG: response regulator [Bacteroidetes bacterium]|nr:response regulator [Bacteroidota bacterium]MBU1720774.1 response regulator [Bacteroidota bacterium]
MAGENFPILIVEDNIALAELIRIKLVKAGYRNHRIAGTGRDVIRSIAEEPPTLMLLDYTLPDMLADELVQKLADDGIQIPFIMMTGHGDELIAVKMMKLGAINYVTKEGNFANKIPAEVEKAVRHIQLMQESAQNLALLHESEATFLALTDNLKDIVIMADGDKLIYVNNGFDPNISRIFHEHSNIRKFLQVIPCANLALILEKTLLDEGSNSIAEEVQMGCKQYPGRWIWVRSFPVSNAGEKSLRKIVILSDITERKEFERKILETIIHTEEKERKLFAQDLHDGLGPLISGIKHFINAIENRSTNEEVRSLATEAKKHCEHAIDETRSLANDVTPAVLEDFGLVRAIEFYVAGLRKTTDLIVVSVFEYNCKLSPLKESMMLRVVRELISNSVKHASAKQAVLKIFGDGGIFTLDYCDSGIGIQNQKEGEDGGHGLRNIRNRVASIGGRISAGNREGAGYGVNITIPY